MEHGGTTWRWGRPAIAVIGVAWVGMGFWSIEDGRAWHGVAGVSLGLLSLASFAWPGSRPDRFLSTPILGHRRKPDEVSAPGRG